MDESRRAGIPFYTQSDNVDTTSAIHVEDECILHGVLIGTDGTNEVTLTVYDGLDDTGVVQYTPDIKIAGASGLLYISPAAVHITTGVYLEVSVANGGSCNHRVFYDQ